MIRSTWRCSPTSSPHLQERRMQLRVLHAFWNLPGNFSGLGAQSHSKSAKDRANNMNILEETVYSAPFAEFGIRRENEDMAVKRMWLESTTNTLITGPEARLEEKTHDWLVGIGFGATPRNAWNFKEFYREQKIRMDSERKSNAEGKRLVSSRRR